MGAPNTQENTTQTTEESAPVQTETTTPPTNGTPVAPATQDASGEPKTVTMTQAQLNERLQRAKSTELKKLLGTDDPAVIKQQLAEYQEAVKAKEENRLKSLSEVERAKEIAKKAETEVKTYKVQLERERNERLADRQELRVTKIADQYINPKYAKHALRDMAEYVKGKFTPQQAEKLGDKFLNNFFAKYAKDNPGLAKTTDAPKVTKQTTRTATNGSTTPKRPSTPQTGLGNKTLALGKANSMTDKEAEEWRRSNGFTY